MTNTVETALFAVFWTTTAALAVVSTMTGDIRLMLWAVMFGLVSCVGTGHIIIHHALRKERVRVETLVEGLVAAARYEQARPDAPRLLRR